MYSKNLDGAFYKICVLFANQCIGKRSNQKVGELVNNHFVKLKNVLECFKLRSNADYHKLSVPRVNEFSKIIDNKKFNIAIAIDFQYKKCILENHIKLGSIIGIIIFLRSPEISIKRR